MNRPVSLSILVALIALPSIASAQAEAGQAPQRTRSVQLTKGQACPPPSTPGEIVVCSTIDEPYRIPKSLRDDGPLPAASQSWVNRAATVDQISRVAGGLPDTCSPVGTGGQSGCALMWNRAYAAERRANANAAESIPGGEK